MPTASEARLRLGALFGAFEQVREAALGAAGDIGMNDPLGSGPIQLLGDEAEFALGFGQIPSLGRGADFLDLGLESRLDGPVLRAALEALAMAFLGAAGGGHSSMRCNDYR